MNIEQMKNYPVECILTGKTEDLQMHALRNNDNHIVGWVFVHKEQIGNLHEILIHRIQGDKEEPKENETRIIGYSKNRIDNL